ncbi:hypothetical protein O0Q50_02890 [Priestia aryabhattai]|uniref:Uncharacterized protein n=1 Tax=Priestia aryabhattai TaxID=412384 RepID=A0AAX6N2G4_PRIAR|nr:MULTISPECIES: hypothetical protein [Priestia]MDU9690101.1 hypothetical protein [Priestia aryabhattai]MED5243960.1 hypothetical protein [Priestia sp. LL-8]
MIDNRLRKIKNHEIDDSLSELTDTEVLLNFQRAITSLYPHLIRIHAHAVHFNLVEVDVVCAQSNKRIGIDGCTTFFIHKDDVEFEFVAETFNQKLQK